MTAKSQPPPLDDATAGVIAPPPLIFAAFALAAWGLGQWQPAPMLEGAARWIVTAILLLAGAGLGGAALWQFRRCATNVRPDRPALALATDGVYRFTRNPMYLAATLIYLALAAADDNAWFLLCLWPLLGVMIWGVIGREERYLQQRFGPAYRDYCHRVRRWL